METKKKKYSIEKHPNAHRRLLKVKPVVNMLENFNKLCYNFIKLKVK